MPALTPFGVSPGSNPQPVPDDSLRVLLTGYGPFFRYRENASWLAVRSLNNTYLKLDTSHSPDSMVEDDTLIPNYTNGHGQTCTQLIHITSLQLPLTYQAILDIVPGFHTRPPTLPPSGGPRQSPCRTSSSRLRLRYRMKDTTGEHAPVVDYLPDASTAAGHEASQAEMLENVQLLGSPRLPSSMGEPTNPADVTVEVPVRGFGKGYEGFADDFYTAIDVERLVHDLKHLGIEHVYSSLDAGHYVCDFTYYCSLAEAKRTATKHDKGKHTKVLFMHCPPVDQPFSIAEVTEAVQKIIIWFRETQRTKCSSQHTALSTVTSHNTPTRLVVSACPLLLLLHFHRFSLCLAPPSFGTQSKRATSSPANTLLASDAGLDQKAALVFLHPLSLAMSSQPPVRMFHLCTVPRMMEQGLDSTKTGNCACGKTSLLCSFALGEFPKEYQPTIFENYVAEIRLDGKPVQLALWDTAYGTKLLLAVHVAYSTFTFKRSGGRLRPLSYSKSHVILIAFSIDTPDSLENVTVKWIEEVRSICGPVIPIILVGCKADLRPPRDAPNINDYVSRTQAERVAQAIGARAYKECSALKIEGVDDVFEAATRASMLMREGVPAGVGDGSVVWFVDYPHRDDISAMSDGRFCAEAWTLVFFFSFLLFATDTSI
ncbi:hypothetical protein EVG20_g7387 [Dentipellis fragilis]|uniref:Uncharacterized protein n=1 Tax=Dentipellis fragilis TaxID=205917 RepID=A0A4Y9YDB4_9AGAM|nr:hypothetical protein EVG20_g7387 [Dentipellis fragilis]